jgi:hypothetical protein
MAVLNELQNGLLYHDLPPAIWPEPSHLAPMSFGGISPSIALSSPTSVPGSDKAATAKRPKERSLPEQLHDVWDHATPGGPLWIARSLLRGVAAIGGGATGKYDIEPETPGMISETDLARLDATNAELLRRITDFASLARRARCRRSARFRLACRRRHAEHASPASGRMAPSWMVCKDDTKRR